MYMAAGITKDERVRFLKEMFVVRRENNYMFIPECRLDDIIGNHENIYEVNRKLIDADWGNWLPKPKETLTQNYKFGNDFYKYEITLVMNDCGFKTVYMHIFDIKEKSRLFFYATSAYYNQAFVDDTERYTFVCPNYRCDSPHNKWSIERIY